MDREPYVLVETAAGFLLAHCKQLEHMASKTSDYVDSLTDISNFLSVVSIVSFHPFSSSAEAQECLMGINHSRCTETLSNFLHHNLAVKKISKKQKLKLKNQSEATETLLSDFAYVLYVAESGLCKSLLANAINCQYNPALTNDIFRAFRQHIPKIVSNQFSKKAVSEHDNLALVTAADYKKFQVGLGHAFSRCVLKEDPNQHCKPICNAISVIDSLTKNLNKFYMRLCEWYSYHFPELQKICSDPIIYAKLVLIIRIKERFEMCDSLYKDMLALCGGKSDIVDSVVQALKFSMGQEISDNDFISIEFFANEFLKLHEMKDNLSNYIHDKLEYVAPNLQELLGDTLSARLISHCGSVVNLAKSPASTIQILGAEKALFRALKAKENTPKYGLLFHSTFIGRSSNKGKGRISRFLANKCAIASRIDAFSDRNNDNSHRESNKIFGSFLKEQVEERMKYLTTGTKPRRNKTVMHDAVERKNTLLKIETTQQEKERKKEKKKKRKMSLEISIVQENPLLLSEKKKKKKKRLDKGSIEITA